MPNDQHRHDGPASLQQVISDLEMLRQGRMEQMGPLVRHVAERPVRSCVVSTLAEIAPSLDHEALLEVGLRARVIPGLSGTIYSAKAIPLSVRQQMSGAVDASDRSMQQVLSQMVHALQNLDEAWSRRELEHALTSNETKPLRLASMLIGTGGSVRRIIDQQLPRTEVFQEMLAAERAQAPQIPSFAVLADVVSGGRTPALNGPGL